MRLRTLAPSLALVALGCAAPPPRPAAVGPVPSVAWPVPPGWKSETLPFPLDFAPDLPHRGTEEIRFAPGFSKPGTPGYWSYAFVWRLEDPASLDAVVLSRELSAYFRGLVAAVNAETHLVPVLDAAHFAATLSPQGDALAGSVETYDPFVTGGPLTLHARVRALSCGSGRTALIFVLTPASADSPFARQLGALAEACGC